MTEDRFEAFRREISSGIVPPEFRALENVSRRRHRIAAGGVALTLVAVVAVGVSGVHALSNNAVTPTHGGTSTSRQTVPRITAPIGRPLIRLPRGDVQSVAQSNSSTDVMAILASGDATPTCASCASADRVWVTDDGFKTSHTVMVHSGVLSAVGPSTFVVCGSSTPQDFAPEAQFVEPNGSRRSAAVSSAPGPLAPGEYPVACQGEGAYFFAVNPGAGTAHPLSRGGGGDGDLVNLAQTPAGTVWGTIQLKGAAAQRAIATTDRGATWTEQPTQCPDGTAIPSADATIALLCIGSGHSGTWSLSRSTDDGQTWTHEASSTLGRMGVNWAVVQMDGSVLLGLFHTTAAGASQVGFIAHSEGTNWTRFTRIHTALPAAFLGRALLAAAAVGGQQDLYLFDSSNASAYRSLDGGKTWTLLASR